MPFSLKDINGISPAEVLPVTYYGDPKLEQPSHKIEAINETIRELARNMLLTMYENNGIGLAGPQVGKNLRIVTIDIPSDNSALNSPGEQLLLPRMPLVLINPVVSPVTAETDVVEEGCLSFPEIYGNVERPVTVMLQTELLDGEKIQVPCGGLLGRCLQHEVDHLDGVIFVKRMDEQSRKAVDRKLKLLKSQTQKKLKNK